MHERERLRRSATLLTALVANVENHDQFIAMLGAFLTEARSILQSVYELGKTDRMVAVWYDAAMSSPDGLFKFFREERNKHVHEAPTAPSGLTVATTQASANGTGAWLLCDPADMAVSNADGSKMQQRTRYLFDNWKGREDVPTLCRNYLDKLTHFVDEGERLGYLSPERPRVSDPLRRYR